MIMLPQAELEARLQEARISVLQQAAHRVRQRASEATTFHLERALLSAADEIESLAVESA